MHQQIFLQSTQHNVQHTTLIHVNNYILYKTMHTQSTYNTNDNDNKQSRTQNKYYIYTTTKIHKVYMDVSISKNPMCVCVCVKQIRLSKCMRKLTKCGFALI